MSWTYRLIVPLCVLSSGCAVNEVMVAEETELVVAEAAPIESELLDNWDDSRNQPRVAERQAYGYVTVLKLAIDSN